MAGLSGDVLTLVGRLNSINPDGSEAVVARVLDESNQIFNDAIWLEANGPTHHQITRDAALPTGTFRQFNEGVAQEEGKGVNVLETMSMLEAFSKPDKKLVDLAGNPEQERMNRARRFIEGMGQNWAGKMIYGNASTAPSEFTGLTPRLNALAQANVVGGGGTGSDLTSIYGIQWNPAKAYMIHPKGHISGGIVHDDQGVDRIQDTSSNDYMAYVDHFEINGGFSVEDELCIGRYCNIETSGSSNTFDEDFLITLIYQLRFSIGVLYQNRTIMTQSHIKLKDKNNVNFTADNGEGLAGTPVIRFMGWPMRLVEQILNTESVVA